MHFPLNFNLFGTQISAHLITEIAAFFIAYRLYIHKKKKIEDAYTSEQRFVILIAAALGALVFSRLLAALENPKEWLNSTRPWLYLYSNKTVVGGLLGGWLFVEIAKKFMKMKASSGDVMTYPIILGICIGRIGCFSQGVYEMTYGNPTNSVFGMDLGDGIRRHPLALYEIVLLICIALFLYFYQKKHAFNDGMQFKSMMFLYLAYRFMAEWMKPHFPLLFGLTSIQLAILITYLLYLPTLIRLVWPKP